ncbi:MAG: hypothetical protein MUE72_10710 [Chitinophagaceae bacterium]|nr:hypothetical protein [Chitinophagaceae bacterium]
MTLLKIIIIAFLSLVYFNSCSHQDESEIAFSYDLFSKYAVKSLDISEYNTTVIPLSDSSSLVCDKNLKINLKICSPRTKANTNPFIFRDFIVLHNKKFNIDSLYYSKEFNNDSKFGRYVAIKTYQFTFNQDKFLVIYLSDLSYPSAYTVGLPLLFNITNPKNVIYIPTKFQNDYDNKCLGDFNGDNRLDFIYWHFFADTLKCYTLIDNKFQLIKDRFLILKIKNYKTYFIDVKKSKWFFRLKNSKYLTIK